MPAKQPLLEEEKHPNPAKDPAIEPTVSTATPTVTPAASLQRALQAPHTLTVQHVQQLQQSAGNRAVNQLVNGTSQAKGAIQRLYVNESSHYGSDRDDAHAKAKTALEAADSDLSISYKIYNKHKKAEHGGKCVTTWKASKGGYLITVTYAGFDKGGRLTYDTAFLSKTVASQPESSAITYSPDSPTIDVT